MDKLNRKKRHKVKPVNELIKYCMDILNILADKEPKKGVNEICKALNDKGLRYKRDAIDTIHKLDESHILKIFKSDRHVQKYEVQLTPLGNDLITFKKNIDQSIQLYEDLRGTIDENFACKQNIPFNLKPALLANSCKRVDTLYHNRWLEEGTIFMVRTLFAIHLASSTSYMRLLSKVKDNEPAITILNEIFTDTLKRYSTLQVEGKPEVFMSNVFAQMQQPLIGYIVEYWHNWDLNRNIFLERKQDNLLKSVYSIIDPGKDVNDFNSLLMFILSTKEANLFYAPQEVSSLPAF